MGMLVCFVLGEISIYMQTWWITIVMAAGVIGVLICFIYANGIDTVLLLLLLFYGLGMIFTNESMKRGILDDYCSGDGIKATVTGQVEAIERTSGGVRIYLKDCSIETEKLSGTIKERIIFYVEREEAALGQTVCCDGALQMLKHATNPGGFDACTYYRSKNVKYELKNASITIKDNKIWRFREWLRQIKNRFAAQYQKLLTAKEAGLLEAIVLGEKADMDSDLKKQYQQAGIAHVIAISGLHIGLIGITLFEALRKFKWSYPSAAIFAGGIILLYGIFTGMSGSCKRALIMLIVSFLGKVIGRAYDLLSSMSFAALIILIDSPMQLMDAGFLLSFGAIFGIGAVYPCLNDFFSDFFRSKKLLNKLWESFLISFSIQVVTIPVIAWFYYEIPMYSVFLNLVIIPLMSMLVPSAMLGLFCSLISIKLGALILFPARVIMFINEFLSDVFNHLPYAHFVTGRPELWQLFIYLALVVIILISVRRRVFIGIAAAAAFLLIGSVFLPVKELSVTMLDVGQGDGMVIEFPTGEVILIDGGSSSEKKLYEYTYAPYLKSQGIVKVDMVIISHADMDHISAVKEMIEQHFPIGKLVLPDIAMPEDNYRNLVKLAKENGVNVQGISRGDRISVGNARLTCLHPPEGYKTEDANEYSATIDFEYKGFSMLFTGDLGGTSEEQVTQYMNSKGLSGYQVLKVGHHGSDTSSSDEFLKQVSPKAALISVGYGNSYGHPDREVLKRLCSVGAKVYRTDENGAINLLFQEDKIVVEGYVK